MGDDLAWDTGIVKITATFFGSSAAGTRENTTAIYDKIQKKLVDETVQGT